ncbi:MAG: hypothetical protein ACPG5Z_00300 [Pseudoalteromonas sp.]
MTTEIQDLSDAEAKALEKVPDQHKEEILKYLRDYQAQRFNAFKKKKVAQQNAAKKRKNKLKRKAARKDRKKNR